VDAEVVGEREEGKISLIGVTDTLLSSLPL
jgi:hypothetical protein